MGLGPQPMQLDIVCSLHGCDMRILPTLENQVGKCVRGTRPRPIRCISNDTVDRTESAGNGFAKLSQLL